jgi:anthranilate synthase component I
MRTTYSLSKKVVKQPADTITPVGVYLKLRDMYPGALLLECTDYSSQQNAFSHICLNPILGVEVTEAGISTYYPNGEKTLRAATNLVEQVNAFIGHIEVENRQENSYGVDGLFGFTSFDSAVIFDKYSDELVEKVSRNREIPFLRYDLFKVVISFNHFNETLIITEFYNEDSPLSLTDNIRAQLTNRNFGSYPFGLEGGEQSPVKDADYKAMVAKAKHHCQRGDVFQLVVSKPYYQPFKGDEFNVYRALRSVNPSPYLFYFDYIGYKIFGSSPEAQLKVSDGKATINPIAGTVKRTGDVLTDYKLANELINNPKENSEHVMLVDLARNDLSRSCDNVQVEIYKEVQTFSHVIHLVSTVTGDICEGSTPFTLFADTFPAGTLSGAPKHKAIELIVDMEPTQRGYYGGGIGYIGLDGSLNHAITIRSFFSKSGVLTYQAGAGIVINSTEEGELQEVNNKLRALRSALELVSNYINQ